jgi:phosphoglycolate phosphatase
MNLIFDFDGTICDSLDVTVVIVNSFISKQPKLRHSYFTKNIIRRIGTKGAIEKIKFSKIDVLRFVHHYRKEISKNVPSLEPFKEIPEVIGKLSKNNKLGIVTTNARKNIELFLNNHNLNNLIDFIYTDPDLFGKENKLKKAIYAYKLDPKDTYYIGDEVRDVEAAKKAEINSIAVTWGYESKELLKKANPDLLVERPQQLSKVFNN